MGTQKNKANALWARLKKGTIQFHPSIDWVHIQPAYHALIVNKTLTSQRSVNKNYTILGWFIFDLPNIFEILFPLFIANVKVIRNTINPPRCWG